MNQYIAVHEFGHIFVGRKSENGDSVYLSLVENPNGASALSTASGNFIMGYRGYILRDYEGRDWQRSNIATDNG
jgi:hypothetical protein